jgi:NAD(P)H-dependent FMN reductase
MADTKLFIPVLLGTVRKGNNSSKVANLIVEHIAKNPEIETKLISPDRFTFPMNDEGQSLKTTNPEYTEIVTRADGFIIVFPEYNHGYPGSLKMMLDMALKEYIHKPVALCGVSIGMFGGSRGIENLVPVVRELGLAVTFSDLYFPKVGASFDESGKNKDEAALSRIDTAVNELVWMAKSLRWGRENLPSKHHDRPSDTCIKK